ncbi:protein FAR1-RELATED SEQUENCE 9-like [Wolffia australiana]
MEGSTSEEEGSSVRDGVDLNEEGLLEQQSHGVSLEGEDGGSEPYVGMEFESEEAAKLFYMAYASRVGFSVRISKSRRSRNDESIIMRRFVCSKEGFHMKKEASAGGGDEGKRRRKRTSIREGCQAMIEVIQKYYGRWVVTKFAPEHNHAVLPPSRVRYVAPEEYADLEPFVGMEFSSHEDAQTFYYAFASRLGFDVRIRLSRRSTRDDSFVMRRFVCTREGFAPAPSPSPFDEVSAAAAAATGPLDEGGSRKARRSHHHLHHHPREGCKAMFEVIRKDFHRWVVSKLELEHTHELAVAPSRVHYIQSQTEVVVLAKTSSASPGMAMSMSMPPHNGPPHHHHHHHHHHPHHHHRLPSPEAVAAARSDDGGAASAPMAVGAEETQNLLDYFKRTQEENAAFFYAFKLDKKGCLSRALWADAKARMSYYSFGDAVTLDASLLTANHGERTAAALPLVTFTGVNHHLQPVIFGAALLLSGESEAAYAWALENWLLAMCGRAPASLTTDPGEAVSAAAARVLPGTRHRLNKWSILSRTRRELSNVFAKHVGFRAELDRCVHGSETPHAFEQAWAAMVERYSLGENPWLHTAYALRRSWVSAYNAAGDAAFSGELSPAAAPPEPAGFFGKYFSARTPPLVMVSLFEQAVSCWYEREALEDLANLYTKPEPRTPSLLLKQAAELYTRAVFDVFEEELIQSLGYGVERIALGGEEEEEEDGLARFRVARDGGGGACVVSYAAAEKKARCSCGRWVAAGMLCRHVLRVLPVVGVCGLPEDCVLKRWTKNARNGLVLDECVRYNDICRDASKLAREGASSMDAYKVAKEALQMAFAELVAAKKGLAACTL